MFKHKLEKIKKAKREGRLQSALASKARPYLSAIGSIVKFGNENAFEIRRPSIVANSKNPQELEVVERIFESYKKMKAAEGLADPLCKPSLAWQEQINNSYAPFLQSLESDSIEAFHHLLSNFGSWPHYTGISGNMLMRSFASNPLGRRYLTNTYFNNHVNLWKWLHGARTPVSELDCPVHGNQAGVFHEGNFIVPSSCANHYNTGMLSALLNDDTDAVIGELGGGCGQFAYYLLKKLNTYKYIDYDLPEPLCVAAYYLMLALPDKGVNLFGESRSAGTVLADLNFVPNFLIKEHPEIEFDLFLNKNSLGEMNSETIAYYLEFILDKSYYFFHMNHDNHRNVFSSNYESLLSHEFPVNDDQYELLFRYPDIWHMLQNNKIDFYMDIFMYLYKRR